MSSAAWGRVSCKKPVLMMSPLGTLLAGQVNPEGRPYAEFFDW